MLSGLGTIICFDEAKLAVFAQASRSVREDIWEMQIMEAWQQRVVDEKAELDQKIGRLLSFMKGEKSTAIGQDERDRLGRQSRYMERYSEVLGERIADFK